MPLTDASRILLRSSRLIAVAASSLFFWQGADLLAQACDPVPANLVSWWTGNGTTADLAGGNNGTLEGQVSYVAGKVGQAFAFDGSGEAVSVGNPGNLQLQDFTIDAWIQRGSTNIASHDFNGGTIFGYGAGGYLLGLKDNGQIFLTDVTLSEDDASTTITDTNWHHLAVAKESNSVVFYVDGAADPVTVFNASFQFNTAAAIGARGDNFGNSFLGQIDEVDVFNRALSAAEIEGIYAATSAGKCAALSPPNITTQPASQTVAAGISAAFSVTATGSSPLTYQWLFDNTNIAGATAATLTLTDVQSANAGDYSVAVSNASGSILSSNAILIITSAVCAPVPAGLVSWWKGEGTAVDSQGQNNGVLTGSALYEAGEVGQCFAFDGSGQAVLVGDPVDLQLQNFTIDAWIQRGSTTIASHDFNGGTVFGFGSGGYLLGLFDDGQVFLSQVGVSAVSSAAQITDTNWHHLALSKSNANVVFYVDGVAYPASSYGAVFNFNSPAAIGARGDNFANCFLGRIDEVDVFNRALSAIEIQSIFGAASAGKCGGNVPSITMQPIGQIAVEGATVTFNVSANSLTPFGYQWQFDGANLGGATNSVLTLPNVQLTNEGSYTVIVTNNFGSVTSSVAVLAVNAASCAPPPAGLVSWWTGNGTTADSVGGNGGIEIGGAAYAPGEVAQAFSFNGSGQGVLVGSAGDLQLQNFTIDAWIQRGSTSIASHDFNGGAVFGFGIGGYLLGLFDDGQVFLSQVGITAVSSSAQITDTNWHHLALSKSNTNVVFYVDGVAYPAPSYGAVFTFTSPAAIGARGDNFANCFLGRIDEVDVFNRALSAVEIRSIYQAANAGKCAGGIAPAISMQPADESVAATGTASFSVLAAGSGPFAYQWSFNSNSLGNATSSGLTLTNIQPTNAGGYSVVITNAYGSITSRVATLTVLPPPSLVQVVSVSSTNGTAVVPVNLIAQGEENALGFTIDFDSSLLTVAEVSLGSGALGASLVANTNQLALGRLGIAISLPANAVFAAGTQQVVEITFSTSGVTKTTIASIAFGDQPILRQISNPQAGVLASTFSGGNVTLPFLGYEGDVAPAPNGDNVVSITDWVQLGRFVAALDAITNAGEFQRADCAPRSSLGDGLITVADWVQAGRYAAGLDPLTPAGGPSQPVGGSPLPNIVAKERFAKAGASTDRTITIINTNAQPGQSCLLSVQLNSQGNENALGFSLDFDPQVLRFTGATVGAGAAGATLNVNTNQAASGVAGLALALPIGTSFTAAIQEVAKLNFTVLPTASGTTTVSFASQPVIKQIVDATAASLSAAYVNGTLAIVGPPLSAVSAKGNLTLSWAVSGTDFILESNPNLASPIWTPVMAATATNANSVTVTVPVSGSKMFYRLSHP